MLPRTANNAWQFWILDFGLVILIENRLFINRQSEGAWVRKSWAFVIGYLLVIRIEKLLTIPHSPIPHSHYRVYLI